VVTVPLTQSLMSGLSPVFTPDGSQLLFISQEAAAVSGVHAATSALYGLAWTGQVGTVFRFCSRCCKWRACFYIDTVVTAGACSLRPCTVFILRFHYFA
jgi:hypothetical protein